MSSSPPDLDRPESAFHTAAELIRAGEWKAGLEAADAASARGEEPDGAVRLLLGIALVRSGAWQAHAITPDLVRNGDPADLRRLLLGHLIQRKSLEEAANLLGVMIEANPPGLKDQTQRASLYARLGRWDDAIADIDHVAAADPDDGSAQGIRLQYRIQGGKVHEAADMARSMTELPTDDRTLNMMVLALIRDGDAADAAKFVDRIPRLAIEDPLLAGNMLQALLRAGRTQDAIDLGQWFVGAGVDGPLVRSYLGQAWYKGGPPGDRFSRAIEHLQAGVADAPDDLRMVSLLGQLLLRTGKTAAAIPYLRKSVELQPEMTQIRALYARALKEDGQLAEAAEQFTALIEKAPDRGGRWQRYAAGALAQAGRREEAADLFDQWVAARAEKLPDSFGQGLDELWSKVDEVRIPKARLDWAWRLRSPDCDLDRAEWDRRAKWGYLADHYLLDWLECRDEQVEEAMQQFADELDQVEVFIEEARKRAPGKGCVFASAHVGAMYFGPLALELLGVRSRWLASTPSVARTSYAQSLISTSDQTQAQVARGFLEALRQDYTVVVVVDGAINLAAPRIDFEGQEITFSEFAARTAHRTGSSSAFVAPIWRDNHHLGFVLEHLPLPEEGESADDYALRWRTAYLGHLRKFLAGRPENLRLSGGIWRHIR